MRDFVNNIDVILPIALLILTYTLRLFIDKSVDGLEFLKSLCEFSVDIIFLSLSFLIAFTISHKGREIEGLLYFIVYLVIAIVVIFLRRRSIKLLEGGRWIWIFILLLNLTLSVTAIFGSISLFSNESKKPDMKHKLEQSKNGI